MTARNPLAPLALALALAAPGCKPAPAPTVAVDSRVLVEVATAQARTFRGLVPLTGELKPINEVTIKSRIGGVVTELTVDEGDHVKRGQLIARIEDQNPQAGLRSAKASIGVAEAGLTRAQAELERLKRDRARIEMLASRGAADQRSLDDIRSAVSQGEAALKLAAAQVDQSQAGFASAQVAVRDTRYTAPIDGVVSRRGVTRYEYLDTLKSRDIVTIVDSSVLELHGTVPGDLAGGVVVGARVEFNVNGVVEPLRGELSAVNPTVDARTRTLKVRARIPNDDGRLKGGMYVTGAVTVGRDRSALAVPAVAVHAQAGEGEGEAQSVVWRVAGEKAEPLRVRVGARDGDFVEVVAVGETKLAAGDTVVTSNPGPLRPGTAVKTRAARQGG